MKMSAMDIFLMLTTLMGGLALFLYGMGLMSDSLTSMTGNGLRNVIEKLTKKKVSGYLFGTGITALVQSSSTTTVMVVGFVNAGVMTLIQAVNVILGANLGTTATAWLLSLNGIEGNNLVLALLKPANIAPFFAVGAVFCTMFHQENLFYHRWFFPAYDGYVYHGFSNETARRQSGIQESVDEF